jgi:MarR family transcriptional regulator, organic hydroperoxide resistance regulator
VTPDEDSDALPGGGLGYALAAAAHEWRADLAEALADLGVTPSQFFVLASLLHSHARGSEAPTQKRLAELSGMDPNTVSQVLRGLDRRGIVSRERREQDSRSVAVVMSAEGLELARTCAQRARALNREFFADVDDEALFGTLSGLAAEARRRRERLD